MRAQADSMQSSGINISTEGPEAMQALMWQKKVSGVVRVVSACLNKVNPLFQGVQHLISPVWLHMYVRRCNLI